MQKITGGKAQQDGSQFLQSMLKDIVKERSNTLTFPKQDYQKQIEFHLVYVNELRNFLAACMDKQKVMIKQGEASRYAMAKLALEIYEINEKLQIQEKLVYDEQLHFEKIFLPSWDKKLKECEEKWDDMYARAQKVAAENNEHEYYEILRIEIDRYQEHEKDYPGNWELRRASYDQFIKILGKIEKMEPAQAAG